MPLFLSKFLPIFFYPLGLSTLLLAIALGILFWQSKRSLQVSSARKAINILHKNRFASILMIATLVLLLLSSSEIFSKWLVRSLEWRYLTDGNIPQAEAIVVLGGGTRPQIAPRPWYELNEAGDRILYGSWLYKQGKAPVMVVTGGRAEWIGEGGNPESEDMAAIASMLGVSSDKIIQESSSFNTRENAVNTKQILYKRGINKILLVTSAMHMPRAMEIFRRVGFEVIAAPTDFLSVNNENNKGFAIILDLLPSAEALRNTTNALKEYVGLFAYQLAGLA